MPFKSMFHTLRNTRRDFRYSFGKAMDETNLEWWRQKSDHWITPLEEVKEGILEKQRALDDDFPEWKGRYEASPSNYLTHDARREYFVSLRVILQNAQLSYAFMRDQMCDPIWWRRTAGSFSDAAAVQALREHALMVKFFTVHSIGSTTEETFRAMVRSVATFIASPQGSFQSIYGNVTRVLEMQDLRDLFDILRLTRNTIHTNGVFSETDSVVIPFGGKEFHFESNRVLGWLGEDFLVWLPNQLSDAMIRIVRADDVASVDAIPRGVSGS